MKTRGMSDDGEQSKAKKKIRKAKFNLSKRLWTNYSLWGLPYISSIAHSIIIMIIIIYV